MSGSRTRWLLPATVLLLAAGASWLLFRKPPAAPAGAPLPAASSAAPAPLSASQVERGIDRARDTVQKDPKDAAGWAMLAHSYEMIGRFDQATEAYVKLLALRPQDAQAHADYADALGVANKGSLQGEPARLIAQALALEPGNLKALVLGGKEAFERKRYEQAIALWERALTATTDAVVRRPIETSIAEARAFMAPAGAAPASAPAAGGPSFVSGKVTVAAALQGKIGPDDTVFVFARPAEGTSRMPIALLRKRGSDLPLDFALDDTLAMVPTARLSQHPRLLLGVRVSKRGDAIPVAGDLEGELGPVKLGSTGLKLEISRVRP
jgi:cytochrome c-type biogenesis protein CcmH